MTGGSVCFAVGLTNRFMCEHMNARLLAAKCIMRYINSKMQHEIVSPVSQRTGKLELE